MGSGEGPDPHCSGKLPQYLVNFGFGPPFGEFGPCNLAEIAPSPSRPKGTKLDVRVEGEIFTLLLSASRTALQ